jgi:hypothetical protein
MARWGNALGGWRKQRRNAKGQFGSSGGASKAKRATNKKPGRQKASRKDRRSAGKAYRKELKGARKDFRAASKASNAKRKADFKRKTTAQQRYNPYSIKGAEKRGVEYGLHQGRIAGAGNELIRRQTTAVNKKRAAHGKKKLTQKQVRRRNVGKAVAASAAVGVAVSVASNQLMYEAIVSIHARSPQVKAGGFTRKDVWNANGGGLLGSAIRGGKRVGEYGSMTKNTASVLRGAMNGTYGYKTAVNGAGETVSAWVPRKKNSRAIGKTAHTGSKKSRRGVYKTTSAKRRAGTRAKRIKDSQVYSGVVI